MTVYVDNMRRRYRTMIMCHMVADTVEELLAMADKIGVKRKWLQSPATRPHFDIGLEKRALAVKAGAIQITMRQAAVIAPRRRSYPCIPVVSDSADGAASAERENIGTAP